jgi:hypothetical protein
MSKYIGKRVYYTCGWCGGLFTLNEKSIIDTEKSGECFCNKKCHSEYKVNKTLKLLDARIVGNISSLFQ